MVSALYKLAVLLGLACMIASLGSAHCASLSRTTLLQRHFQNDVRPGFGGRKLSAADEAVKTIFSNGWATGCGWYASGAFNISVVPGAGVGHSSGLCTTFPGTGGWMTFQCPDADSFSTALGKSSAIQFYISELPDGKIGSSKADETIPAGSLQLVLQNGNGDFTCKRPLGSGGLTSNGLVQTSINFDGSLNGASINNQDCRPALADATDIGFQSLRGGVTFCLDQIQLI